MTPSEMVPGRKYKFELDDCCARADLVGRFIRIVDEEGWPSPTVEWDIGTTEGSLHGLEEVT